MIRCHGSIGRSLRGTNGVARNARDITASAIAATDPSNVADIVAQQRNYEMKPLTWRHATDGNMATAQNFLSDQRHHDGMIDVVVGSVGICNIFKREPTDETDYAGITRLKHSVGPLIFTLKLANKGFNDNLRGIEHRRHLRLGALLLTQPAAPAVSALPTSVMNSRRLIQSPRRRGRAAAAALRGRAP